MRIEFIPKNGHLIFEDPSLVGAPVLEGAARVNYTDGAGHIHQAVLDGAGCSQTEESILDVHGPGSQLSITCLPNADGIQVTCRIRTYEQRSFNLLQLSLTSHAHESIHLQQVVLLSTDTASGGQLNLPGSDQKFRFFKVGWHGWDYTGLRQDNERNTPSRFRRLTRMMYSNTATPSEKHPGEFWSEGWGILASQDSALVAGFVSTAHQFGQVYACTRPRHQALSLSTQLDGILLGRGESCTSEWGFLQLVSLPNPDPPADYVEATARQMHARVPKKPPPAMWTHWYQYFNEITEDLFLRNLETLDHQREILPIGGVELDDGYQPAWGDWTTTNSKFPHGLESLAEHAASRGFTPGLWLSPFAAQASSRLAKDHPDWLVKNQREKPAWAGFVYNSSYFGLDLSHPSVLDHLQKLADLLTHQWGFGMLKLDFLIAGAIPGARRNPRLTRAECLRLGLEAIRQGAGEESFLLGCGCPFGPALGIVDAMRIGPDTVFSWEPYFNWLPWATPLIKHEPSMPSLRNALRHTLNLSTLHQKWWWNDPDCLLVRDTDTRLTSAEVLSAVTLVGLSGGMLILSDDLQKVSPERLKWASLLVPNFGLKGLPLNLLAEEMPGVYRVQVNRNGQSWQLVGLFNWQDQAADVSLDLSQLGFEPGSKFHVFDFWDNSYSQVMEPKLGYKTLPAHGCKLLRICPVEDAHQLVGDNLHISQGAEIASMQMADGKLVIETLDLGRQVEGELWFSLPVKPIMATCNDESLRPDEVGQGIYRLHVNFRHRARVEIKW